MDSLIMKALICILIPMLMLSFLLEKRSRRIMWSLCLGCLACLLASFINTMIYTKSGCSNFYLSTTIAPVIEETLKFIPVLLLSVLISKNKYTLVPLAFAVGIGFAILENSYMLMQFSATSSLFWILIRGIGTGLMHGICTIITGFGISIANTDRRIRVVGSMSALFLAMMFHGAYNCMISTESIKYIGIFLPLVMYAVFFMYFKKDEIARFFRDET